MLRPMLGEGSYGRTEPAGHDFVSVVCNHHRLTEQRCAKFTQETDGLHLAHDLVRVGQAADLCQNPHGFHQTKAAAFGLDRKQALAELDLTVSEPAVERFLWEEDAVFTHCGNVNGGRRL